MNNEHNPIAIVLSAIALIAILVVGSAMTNGPDGKRGCRNHSDTTANGRSCANLKVKSVW